LVTENLTTEEVNKVLFAAENDGRPVFQLAANFSEEQVLQEIFNCAKEIL
jgi:hypothetical protein